MTLNRSLLVLALAVAGAGTTSLTVAQTPAGDAGQSRAAVNAETRQARAQGTLQPAGEAPDPIGGSATPRKTPHKKAHHRHASKKKHRAEASSDARRAAPGNGTAPDPMTEPKK